MFTGIYALGRVVGAEIWCVGCVLCLLVCFVIAFAIKANRRKTGRWVTVAGLLIPALLCDILWFFVYFPQGDYRNMGLAAAGGLLLYPVCLVLGLIGATLINKSREQEQ